MRLVAVLGYSPRRWQGLHPICAERLSCAERIAGEGDTVLLSGWARHQDAAGEVELMREAWKGETAALLSDTEARSTRENALGVAAAARRLDAREVVVVTSSWHAFRARTLVSAALGERVVSVQSASPSGRPPLTLFARELVCLALLPVELIRLRRAVARP